MLNENVVTMSLDDYTKLIIENHNLKQTLLGIKKKVKRDVEETIYYVKISSINSKDEVIKLLDADENTLLSKFTENYDWTWRNISERNNDIVDAQEVKEMAIAEIKHLLHERLGDLSEFNEVKENA